MTRVVVTRSASCSLRATCGRRVDIRRRKPSLPGVTLSLSFHSEEPGIESLHRAHQGYDTARMTDLSRPEGQADLVRSACRSSAEAACHCSSWRISSSPREIGARHEAFGISLGVFAVFFRALNKVHF